MIESENLVAYVWSGCLHWIQRQVGKESEEHGHKHTGDQGACLQNDHSRRFKVIKINCKMLLITYRILNRVSYAWRWHFSTALSKGKFSDHLMRCELQNKSINSLDTLK